MADQALLKQLRALSPQDWASTKNAVDAFFAIGGKAPGGKTIVSTPHNDYLLQAIRDELSRRGRPSAKDYIAKKQHIAAAIGVMGHLEASMPGKLRPVERAALAKLAAKCLADYVTAMTGGNVSLKKMLEHLPNTFLAIDEAFPGYVQAGLLSHCWKSRTKNGRRRR